MNIQELLRRMVAEGATDILFSAGNPPCMRVHGELRPFGERPVSAASMEQLLGPFLGEEQRAGFDRAGYRIPRVACYLGRWIRGTDWYPDWQVRFFDRTRGGWQGDLVHHPSAVSQVFDDMELPVVGGLCTQAQTLPGEFVIFKGRRNRYFKVK